ncbi:MAG: EVE domain-containing protein [Nostocales cyanobacterium 94392]|uniref:EVE domain-containing protein n=1 Tax=Rivularia sp. UHCC 0363 TaxID=3110244 RepID=UPI002B1EC85F|nr:EVE domain-containing protein [Rivularia sp. UHCC 0363]MEA5595736.1 EVE domain-containing protein [Rivularia sp. UHCC 0363]MEB3219673.1 EVE domain-containing protein [Nostocales cyanobacterium 94392]
MSYWLFQGNPKYYRIIEGIRDFEQMPWLTTRYALDMVPGDGVLIWKSGDKAGIYGIAEIIKSPELIKNPPDIGYWIDTSRIGTKPCAKIRFTSKLIDKPLLKEDLKLDPVLKTLTVIRQPNSTNYKVTQQEWLRVYELRK